MKKRIEPEIIYQTALSVFARYGFKRTRVEDVARELDVTPGAMYRYVKDKRELYEQTVAYGIRRWQDKVFEAMDGVADVKDQFLIMCRKGYEYLAQDRDMRAILIDDPTIFPLAPRKIRFPDIDEASITMIRTVLQKGIEQKAFRPVDVEVIAEFLYSIYVMFIIKTYVKSEGRSAQEMFDKGLELLLTGLALE